MGRPREHDERTAAALLTAAERAVEAGGAEALSVRGIANEVGTTTRAVYSLFGSKDGLIAALGARAFEFLRTGLEALALTDDPASDLVETGLVFRRLAIERPALYSIGVQRDLPRLPPWQTVCDAADAAFAVLVQRVARLDDADLLGEQTVLEATLEFHALCEGLATLERRNTRTPFDAERVWRAGLGSLIAGFPLISRARASSRGDVDASWQMRDTSARAGLLQE
jgi:AcrR family transcriptional regulator